MEITKNIWLCIMFAHHLRQPVFFLHQFTLISRIAFQIAAVVATVDGGGGGTVSGKTAKKKNISKNRNNQMWKQNEQTCKHN